MYMIIFLFLLIAEKHFVQIERAKEVLLDKEMRKKYDEWRIGGFKRVVSFRRWLDMQPQVHQVHIPVIIIIGVLNYYTNLAITFHRMM